MHGLLQVEWRIAMVCPVRARPLRIRPQNGVAGVSSVPILSIRAAIVFDPNVDCMLHFILALETSFLPTRLLLSRGPTWAFSECLGQLIVLFDRRARAASHWSYGAGSHAFVVRFVILGV